MTREKSILILGAGEVGTSVAKTIIDRGTADRIILHTSKEQTMHKRVQEMSAYGAGKIEVAGSFGDIFAPAQLMQTSRARLEDVDVQLALVEHFLAPPTEAVLQASAIYQLVALHRPALIVDSVNSATVSMYTPNPSHSYEQLLQLGKRLAQGAASEQGQSQVILQALLSLYIPVLTRYVEALHLAMRDHRVERFVKVSTTGLGNMGFHCPYTHGSLTDIGLSPALVGKLGGSGALHQMLWNLSHTAGLDVKLVVPSALIGWEEVNFGPYKSRGQLTPLTDCQEPLQLSFGERLQPQANDSIGLAEMIYVPAGDNSTYSLEEMSVSTALLQFESVTKEEVGLAVWETLEGSTRYDLLTQMNMATVQPSYLAAHKRSVLLKRMRKLEASTGRPSIASGNLGPRISKQLFELHLLMAVSASPKQAVAADPAELSVLARQYLLEHAYVRQQILSLGLPILLGSEEFLAGNVIAVPDEREREEPLTRERVEKWAEIGWVDIRPERMKYWQNLIREILADNSEIYELIGFSDEMTIGELLACIYFHQGQARVLKYQATKRSEEA